MSQVCKPITTMWAITGKRTEHWENVERRSHTALGASKDGRQHGTQLSVVPGGSGKALQT